MRFIHTADWHLGTSLYGTRLIDDQAYVLDDLLGLVKSSAPDFLILAGDIYDKAVPPVEAVSLLDDVLKRIVIGCNVPVVMIAGNHDSSERINFGNELVKDRGLHLYGLVSSHPKYIDFYDTSGVVRVFPFPYADPGHIAAMFTKKQMENTEGKANTIRTESGPNNSKDTFEVSEEIFPYDHNMAMRNLVGLTRPRIERNMRSVGIAHAFVAGGSILESDSERNILVGGTTAVDPTCFDCFSYTALGHLHGPQRVRENIRYSGSLLKYSFSEEKHIKGVDLVELDAEGKANVEHIPLRMKRDLKTIKGSFEELLRGDIDNDNFVYAKLTQSDIVLDAMTKLRKVYRNILHIEQDTFVEAKMITAPAIDHSKVDVCELFRGFYKEVNNGLELGIDEESAFVDVFSKLRVKGEQEQ